MDIKQFEMNISIVSAVIAVISALFALRQCQLAKRTYKLQKEEYEARKVNYKIQDIREAFLHEDRDNGKVYYFFKIDLVNLSDKGTAIKKVKLRLKDDEGEELIVNYSENVLIKSELKRLSIPLNIDAQSSLSGWVVFEVKLGVLDTFKVSTHIVRVEDIHDIYSEIEQIFIAKQEG